MPLPLPPRRATRLAWCAAAVLAAAPQPALAARPPNDLKPSFFDQIYKTIAELGDVGPAEALMLSAVQQIKADTAKTSTVLLEVGATRPLHPVGSWREHTWATTQKRAKALLAGKGDLLKNDLVLSNEMVESKPALQPLRSVNNIAAIPFPFCGYKYVSWSGNGRMKGIQLAIEEDAEVRGVKVEADLYELPPASLRSVHAKIAKLWGQYTLEAMTMMKSGSNRERLGEYMTFRTGIVKCRGLSERGCPVVKEIGDMPATEAVQRWAKPSEMVGVEYARLAMSSEALVYSCEHFGCEPLKYYKLCGEDGYLLGDALKSVKEYCPMCIDMK